jgi:hypothetical protein
MRSLSPSEDVKAAEVWWLLAAFAFGMCFLYGLGSAWYVYKMQYNPEQKLFWSAACLLLFFHERMTYKIWRGRAQKEIDEYPSADVGGMLKIYD